MRNNARSREANRQYWTAHAAHYTAKDLREALELYAGVMAAHPDTQEAGYSRTQIENIVRNVVPKQELLDSQLELAMVHLARKERGQGRHESSQLRQQRAALDKAWDQEQRERRDAERDRRTAERLRGQR